jgi:hypothetical protein
MPLCKNNLQFGIFSSSKTTIYFFLNPRTELFKHEIFLYFSFLGTILAGLVGDPDFQSDPDPLTQLNPDQFQSLIRIRNTALILLSRIGGLNQRAKLHWKTVVLSKK